MKGRTPGPGREGVRMAAEVENREYLAFLRRALRAAGRRLGGNPDDLLALAEMQRELDSALTAAVLTARAQHGMSWTEIGRLLGVSRQAAQQRFGPKIGAVHGLYGKSDLREDLQGSTPQADAAAG